MKLYDSIQLPIAVCKVCIEDYNALFVTYIRIFSLQINDNEVAQSHILMGGNIATHIK